MRLPCRLGSIDPLLIGLRPGSFPTFDTPVSGLTPNEQYYVVYSEEGGTNLSSQQAIYWMGSDQPDGAFGVGEALGILPPTISTDWHTVRNFPTFGGPPFSVWHWARIEAVTADFNGDGALNTADIDVLSERVRVGSTDAIFDLNADGEVNDADRAFWVEDLAGTVFGDADFDGTVQFSDFLALSSHFGQPGGWGQGDFDGDGEVNFTDFLILSVNFDEGANAAAAAVPEPTGVYLAMFGVLGLMGFRRSR